MCGVVHHTIVSFSLLIFAYLLPAASLRVIAPRGEEKNSQAHHTSVVSITVPPTHVAYRSGIRRSKCCVVDSLDRSGDDGMALAHSTGSGDAVPAAGLCGRFS